MKPFPPETTGTNMANGVETDALMDRQPILSQNSIDIRKDFPDYLPQMQRAAH